MLNIGEKEFWFVVGSQHLYGEEALREVKKHAQEMVDELNENGQLPYPIRLQELAVTADTITKIMKEVNYREEVAGVITWILSHQQKCGSAGQSFYKTIASFSYAI